MADSVDDFARGANPRSLAARYPWLTFVLPFVVYMVVGSFEPGPPKAAIQLPDGGTRAAVNNNWFGLEYRQYPIVYTAKIAALTIASMLVVLPGYRQFPFRISPLAIAVGVVGVVFWIWICHFQIELAVLRMLGLDKFFGLGERPSFNPLEKLGHTPWGYTFLAIRFVGLALIVPIIEEFFLRGCVMRYVQDPAFWEVPFGRVTSLAVIVGTGVPILMHLGTELLAAFVWFSLITWLMMRTKNIWDCVAAHAVTNLLLGVYVVTQHEWQLW